MYRYHKEIYIPCNIKDKLKAFTAYLNTLKWQYTAHSIDNIKDRCYNIQDILSFIKDLKLDYKNIFEVYTDNIDNILKACYRVEYNFFDVILVLNSDKNIITIYMNSKEDKHITLNKALYNKI